jgi:hypothetical protein
MDIRKAIDETMEFAEKLTESRHCPYDLSKEHLREMHAKITSDMSMSDTKLCRWLGWMQAAIVSWGVADLNDMKAINMRNI